MPRFEETPGVGQLARRSTAARGSAAVSATTLLSSVLRQDPRPESCLACFSPTVVGVGMPCLRSRVHGTCRSARARTHPRPSAHDMARCHERLPRTHTRPGIPVSLPLLALSMTLAMAAPVQARNHHDQGSNASPATLQVDFGTTPHWTIIRGTRVEEILVAERPSYDMFRCGGNYYVYDNNQWYSSPRGRGQFILIDDRSVPRALSTVPRQHWRHFPPGWANKHRDPDSRGSLRSAGEMTCRGTNELSWIFSTSSG